MNAFPVCICTVGCAKTHEWWIEFGITGMHACESATQSCWWHCSTDQWQVLLVDKNKIGNASHKPLVQVWFIYNSSVELLASPLLHRWQSQPLFLSPIIANYFLHHSFLTELAEDFVKPLDKTLTCMHTSTAAGPMIQLSLNAASWCLKTALWNSPSKCIHQTPDWEKKQTKNIRTI